MKLKKICASALVLAMTMAALDGCMKTTENSFETKATEPNQKSAMGRYVEMETELPESEKSSERMLRLVQGGDGQAYLYSLPYVKATEADVLCYVWNGSGWDKQESKLNHAELPEADEDSNEPQMLYVQRMADGTEYLSYIMPIVSSGESDPDAVNFNTFILKADPDGSHSLCTDAPITAGYPYYVCITDDGNILLSDRHSAKYYDSNGLKKREFQQSRSRSYRTLVTVSNTEYIALSSEGNSLLRYDLETGIAGEDIPLVMTETGNNAGGDAEGALVHDQEGNLYLINSSGIHYWKKGGSIWETLVDGSLCSLSMPSQSIGGLAFGSDNDYLVLTSDADDEPSILKFYYDPEVPSFPSGTLSIFGLSDNPTIRQAIVQFQMQNPDVRVDFQVGDGGDGSTTAADMIKALNTELVNQKGADILILDGLPIDSYIEKGVLADIGDLINPLLEDHQLLERQAGVFKNEDQSIYGVPVRFQYPIMYGTPEGLKGMQSLEAVKDYNGIVPLLKNRSSSEILKYLMNLYHAELFRDKKTIAKDQLMLLLEAAKITHDRGIDPDMETKAYVMNLYNDSTEFGITAADSFALYNANAAVAVNLLASIHDIMFPAEVIKQLGLEPTTANGIFFPAQIAGVNAASENQELAKKFISLLLSEEIQSVELADGFPVNRAAFESWRIYRDEYSIVSMTISGSDESIDAEWPAGGQQEEIFALQEEMVTPVLTDQVLTEIITDEANTFFNGTVDASEAADAILNRLSLYYAE